MTTPDARSPGQGQIAARWAWIRIGFVLVGGMLVLQSSSSLDAPKLAYLGGVAVAACASTFAVWRNRAHPAVHASAAWFAWSGALVLLLAASLFVALANGTPILSWLRDAATYGLVAFVPVFALDAAIFLPRRGLVFLLVLLGVLGACSWAVVWLDRRAIVDVPFDRLLYAAPQLPVALYLVAIATATVRGRSGLSWALLAGLVLGAFLITATRSTLLYLVGPIAIAVVAGRRRLPLSAGWILVHGIAAVALILAFQTAVRPASIDSSQPATSAAPGSTTGTAAGSAPVPSGPPSVGPSVAASEPPDIIGERIGNLGTVLANPVADPSFKERAAQYEAAWKLFISAPLLGVGPGHLIDWTDVSGFSRSAYFADTPLVYWAKFGVVGLAVLGLLIWAYIRTLVMIVRATGRTVAALTLIGYAAINIVVLPLGFPLEDKGTSFALIVILGLAFMELTPARATTPLRGPGAAPVVSS